VRKTTATLLIGLVCAMTGAAPALADGDAMNPDVVVDPKATIGPAVSTTDTGDGQDFEATATATATVTADPNTGTTPPVTDPVQPTGGTSDTPPPAAPAEVRVDPDRAAAIRRDPGYSNAANQKTAEKRREADRDCVPDRPGVSAMLGVDGTAAGDKSHAWVLPLLVVAFAAVLIALGAFLLRRHNRTPDGKRPERGTLETVATIVAIFGGLAGLAGQMGARLGADAPPPAAAMTIREVNPRITRAEYAHKMGSTVELSPEDAREVGNVIWLEIDLEGYRDKTLRVQWGLYDLDAGEALLPTTAKITKVAVEPADVQSAVIPIWVGYPQSARFEAQFRLLDGLSVRQMASTGVMRGSRYRYACRRDTIVS
jgi:hypothetical protein